MQLNFQFRLFYDAKLHPYNIRIYTDLINFITFGYDQPKDYEITDGQFFAQRSMKFCTLSRDVRLTSALCGSK